MRTAALVAAALLSVATAPAFADCNSEIRQLGDSNIPIRGQAANARSGLVPTGGGPADVAGAVIWRRGEG